MVKQIIRKLRELNNEYKKIQLKKIQSTINNNKDDEDKEGKDGELNDRRKEGMEEI